MTLSVIIYRIDTTYTGSYGGVTYAAGSYIHVILDTVTQAITVELKPSADPSSTSTSTPTSGPNLFFGFDGAVTRVYPVNIEDIHKYCDGSTLVSVSALSAYPYGGVSTSSNHPFCYIAPTCDLQILSDYTVTKATGPANNDGEITISATSSNGTPKLAFNASFDYATDGTATPATFPNILPGTYTIYAKDSLGCLDSIVIEVGVLEAYGVRWRHEYNDRNGELTRIDILERAFVGSLTEVDGGDKPLIISYRGDPNNQYDTIVPSLAEVTLISDVSGQYQDIFTGDDRKYQVKIYKTASLILFWLGYPIPEFYSEPYLEDLFPVTITATDGLGELSNYKFLDANGNNYRGELSSIKIISEILKLAPLGINIRSAINMYDVNMVSAASDDPLAQAYVDTRIFYKTKNEPFNCEEVIKAIIEPFGARLFQSQGFWWIARIEDSVFSALDYRVFTSDGDYSSNSTINTVASLASATHTSRLVWRDRSQILSFIRNFGTFNVIHDLLKDANLIDEGRFEVEDLETKADGTVFFKNWNFNIGQTGISYGIEKVNNGDSQSAFYFISQPITNAQNDSVLYTKEIPVKMIRNDRFKVNFQALVVPYRSMPYIRIGWSLILQDNDVTTDFYSFYQAQNDFIDYETNQEVINDLYIESFDKFQDFELGLFATPIDTTNATLKLNLYFHNHSGRDYNTFAAMRAKATVDLATDSRLYYEDPTDPSNDDITFYYKLESTTDAESEPDIIEPNDYDLTTNPNKWVLQQRYFVAGVSAITKKVLIDNVKISFFPFLQPQAVVSDPPATADFSEVVNSLVKSVLEKELILGDVPDFNNSPNIYKGYFRLSDGTPTEAWARSGVTEESYLINILKNDYKAQLSEPSRKLTGSAQSDTIFHYINSIQDIIDDRKYINSNLTIDDKAATYNLDLIEVRTGSGGEVPPAQGEFAANEFSSDFNIE